MTYDSREDDHRVIERVDAGEPSSSPEETQARAPYVKMFERIRDLEDAAPDPGWEDRALARWAASRRRRRLGFVMGATVAAGLATALTFRPCAMPAPSGLQVTVLTGPGATRRGDAAVGDVLRASAYYDRPHVELRVYIGAHRIVRCPGSAQCQRVGAAWQLDWKLSAAGAYLIVALSSGLDLPAAGDGTIDRDLLEARAAGASVDVRGLTVSQ